MYLYLALIPTWILAQTGAATDPWIDSLLKSGPLGLVLVLIIMDKMGTHGERDRLRVENRELREEVARLNEVNRKEVLPPLLEVARLLPPIAEELMRPRRSKA